MSSQWCDNQIPGTSHTCDKAVRMKSYSQSLKMPGVCCHVSLARQFPSVPWTTAGPLEADSELYTVLEKEGGVGEWICIGRILWIRHCTGNPGRKGCYALPFGGHHISEGKYFKATFEGEYVRVIERSYNLWMESWLSRPWNFCHAKWERALEQGYSLRLSGMRRKPVSMEVCHWSRERHRMSAPAAWQCWSAWGQGETTQMTQVAEREGLQPSERSGETRSAAGSGSQRVTPRPAELVREARSQAPPTLSYCIRISGDGSRKHWTSSSGQVEAPWSLGTIAARTPRSWRWIGGVRELWVWGRRRYSDETWG